MTAVFGVLAAAAALAGPSTLNPERLPALPAHGLVHDRSDGVVLETLRGRPLGVLRGLHLTSRLGVHGLLLQDRKAVLFTIDVHGRRVTVVRWLRDLPAPPGCTYTDFGLRRQLFVCGHRIVSVASGRTRLIARGPGRVGHWEFADLSPDGTAILGQWVGGVRGPRGIPHRR
jgi:hypothetical protein